MIVNAPDLSVATIRADLCVIGTGPGGAMVATMAAEAGLKVVALEAGAFVTPGEMNQREADMFPKLLWESGGRTTFDKAIRIHQGHGVGGSALHNLNLCKRVPAEIRARWVAERRLGLDKAVADGVADQFRITSNTQLAEHARSVGGDRVGRDVQMRGRLCQRETACQVLKHLELALR